MTKTITVEFRCKDDNVAKHQEQLFGDGFRKEIEAFLLQSKSFTLEKWEPVFQWLFQQRMLAEAKLQEHYDYIVGENGRRQVVRDGEDNPVLLIPEVVVS